MRLIDADALISALADWQLTESLEEGRNYQLGRMVTDHEMQYSVYLTIGECIKAVEEEPTIDPVKHGRLIDGRVSFHWTCSECGCHLRKDLGQVFERETDRYNYCPNCGAKYGGEGCDLLTLIL